MIDTPKLPPFPVRFESLLWEILKTRQSISEYELMKYLSEEGFSEFLPDLEPLALFRAHFLLFHLLYRLQTRWLSENRGRLSIHATEIYLQEMGFSERFVQDSIPNSRQALLEDDPIKSYYLDYREFLNTQKEDVLGLLDDFWRSMAGYPVHSIGEEEKLQAQKILGLEDQILSMQSVKLQFRSLCQLHHPDKGGDSQVFRQICDAKNLLLQSLEVENG